MTEYAECSLPVTGLGKNALFAEARRRFVMRFLVKMVFVLGGVMLLCATAQAVVTKERLDEATRMIDMHRDSVKKDDIIGVLGLPEKSKMILSVHFLLYKTEENEHCLFQIDEKSEGSKETFYLSSVDPDDPFIRKIFMVKTDSKGVPLEEKDQPAEIRSHPPAKSDVPELSESDRRLAERYWSYGRFGAYSKPSRWDKEDPREEAIRWLTKAIEINPKMVEAYSARAYAYNQLGDYKHAAEDYEKSMEFVTENDENRCRLCVAATLFVLTCKDARYRDGATAIRYAEKGVYFSSRRSNFNKNEKLMFVHFLASAYAQAGNFEKAVELETQVYKQYLFKEKYADESIKRDYRMFKELIDVYKAGKTYGYWEENRPKQEPVVDPDTLRDVLDKLEKQR